MAITPRNGDLTAGVAGSYSETIGASPDPFITGDVPALFSTDELVLEDEVLEARSVVGLDAAGKLVMAKTTATAVKPIGVLIYAVATGAGDNTVRASVYRGGVFNPDLLVWHADYSTDELKRLAFEGASSPTAASATSPGACSRNGPSPGLPTPAW